MKEKGFNKRGFITFLTLVSFLMMVITGIVLYIVPEGRIAYWVDWKLLGLTKKDWGNIHMLFSLLFFISGSFHIYFNWKPLVNYIINKISGGLKLKKEMAIAASLSIFILFSAIFQIPPLAYYIDLNEYIKKSWIISREYEPPFGHAEELSLKTFTSKMRIDLDKALVELKKKGIKVEDTEYSLEKIARGNKTSPMKLYAVIKKFEQKRRWSKGKHFTPELIEEEFEGTGLGRKTLSEVCENVGVEVANAKERLKKHNIQVKEGEILKEVAIRHSIRPIDILKIILLDDYKTKQKL